MRSAFETVPSAQGVQASEPEVGLMLFSAHIVQVSVPVYPGPHWQSEIEVEKSGEVAPAGQDTQPPGANVAICHLATDAVDPEEVI